MNRKRNLSSSTASSCGCARRTSCASYALVLGVLVLCSNRAFPAALLDLNLSGCSAVCDEEYARGILSFHGPSPTFLRLLEVTESRNCYSQCPVIRLHLAFFSPSHLCAHLQKTAPATQSEGSNHVAKVADVSVCRGDLTVPGCDTFAKVKLAAVTAAAV